MAQARRQPGGGAYGPNTCLEGFVWREAFAGDVVCVTPQARASAARENQLATSHQARATAQPQAPIPSPGNPPPQGPFAAQSVPQSAIPELLGEKFFSDHVAGGLYIVRNVRTQLCFDVNQRGNDTDYIASAGCRPRGSNAGPLFAVVPGPSLFRESPHNASLRPITGVGDANRYSNGIYCAGLATDVAIGPIAIDVAPCRQFNGYLEQDICKRNTTSEQQFVFERVGGETHNYRLRTGYISNGGRHDCVTVRDSSNDSAAEHISWECKNDPSRSDFDDQVFEFIFVAPLPERLASCHNDSPEP